MNRNVSLTILLNNTGAFSPWSCFFFLINHRIQHWCIEFVEIPYRIWLASMYWPCRIRLLLFTLHDFLNNALSPMDKPTWVVVVILLKTNGHDSALPPNFPRRFRGHNAQRFRGGLRWKTETHLPRRRAFHSLVRTRLAVKSRARTRTHCLGRHGHETMMVTQENYRKP